MIHAMPTILRRHNFGNVRNQMASHNHHEWICCADTHDVNTSFLVFGSRRRDRGSPVRTHRLVPAMKESKHFRSAPINAHQNVSSLH